MLRNFKNTSFPTEPNKLRIRYLLLVILIVPKLSFGSINLDQADSIRGQLLKGQADSLKLHSRYPQAIASYHKASEIFKELTLWASYFEARNQISVCKLYIGDYEEGIQDVLLRQDSIQELTGVQSHSSANSYNTLGAFYKELGDYIEARGCYTKSLKIFNALKGDHALDIARVTINIGSIYYSQGNYTEAQKYYTKGLEIRLEKLPSDDPAVGRSFNHVGLCYSAQGQFHQALEYYEKSLRITLANYGESNEYSSFGYTSVAGAYFRNGDLEKSLKNFNKAIELIEKLFGSKNERLIVPLKFRGTIYQQQERNVDAFADFERLNEIALKHYPANHPRVAGAIVMLADYHRNQKNYKVSNQLYIDAAQIYIDKFGQHHPRVSLYYLLIAKNYFDQGNYVEALTWNQRSLKYNIIGFDDESMHAIPPSIEGLSDLSSIVAIQGKVISYEALYDKNHEISSLNNALKHLEFGANIIAESRKAVLRSQDIIEINENLYEYYSSALSVTRKLWLATKDTKYLNMAFSFAEKGKSALLLQSLGTNSAQQFGNIPEETLETEKQLKERRSFAKSKLLDAKSAIKQDTGLIAQWQDSLFNINRAFDAHQAALKSSYPKYHQLQSQEKIVDATEVQLTISEGTALIEYFHGDSATYVFTVSKTGIFMDTVKNLNLDQDRITNFLVKSLKNDNESKNAKYFAQEAFEIYHDYLAQPLSHLDKNINELIVVPDGLLSYIPFEVLLLEDSTTKKSSSFRSLPYLLTKYQISYAHSATTLFYDLTNQTKSTKERFLAFAPTYDVEQQSDVRSTRSTVSRLSYNVPEVSGINELMKGTVVLDELSAERRFKNEVKDYDVVHLAMHAQVDNDHPANSRMIFSNVADSVEDNSLYLHEIYEMKIPTSLIVLSACETGSGKLQRGEGVMSLAHAFTYAGCPSIVMSHWSVDDKSTADVMKLFYINLKDGMDKTQALRKAKLDFLNSANPSLVHPYFWGSFVLLGDGKELNSYRLVPTSINSVITVVIILILLITLLILRVTIKSRS